MIVDAQDIKDEDLLCMAINSSLGLSLISTLTDLLDYFQK